jgi:hypothetical protein
MMDLVQFHSLTFANSEKEIGKMFSLVKIKVKSHFCGHLQIIQFQRSLLKIFCPNLEYHQLQLANVETLEFLAMKMDKFRNLICKVVKTEECS